MNFRTPAITALLVLSCAGAVVADHSEPAKEKKGTFPLVNAYIPCDTPNTELRVAFRPAYLLRPTTPASCGAC